MILTTRSTSFAVASCCMTTNILRGDWRWLGGFGGVVVQLWCVGGMRRRNRLVHRSPAHADADERGDAGLLHRNSIHRVSRLGGGAWVVGDHDELGLVLEAIQHAHEVPDVLIVQWRIDFVEQAERTRLGQEDSEQEREGDERLFAARQQMDALGALAAR